MLCKIKTKNDPVKTGALIKKILSNKRYKIVHVKYNFNFNNMDQYWIECAKCIGKLAQMEENDKGNKTGNALTNIQYPYNKQSESFIHSNKRQPLHTDGAYESNAPPVTFFYCKESPKYGGGTIFLSVKNLKKYMKLFSKELFQKITSTPVYHSKGNDFKIKKIIENKKVNWNYYRCEKTDLRDSFHEFLENYIVGGNLFKEIKLKKGDALFFKDQELLHGRTAFLGNRWLVKGGLYV
jgi:alpha-ketoglutarate-dependent taurine dioxygenase